MARRKPAGDAGTAVSPLKPIGSIYKRNLALLTDLYQLTMGYGYWKSGTAETGTVFNLYFRKNPFGGGFSVAAGLTWIIDYLRSFRFTDRDLAYLRKLKGNDGAPLFESGYLDYLRALKFSCDIFAVPEGTIVYPNEPLIRVQGPLIQCQLIETALLCIANFQTLIATKSARIKLAARGATVLEFGLRRAQGIDGALSGSWAAYIGGCDATSNVLASELFGIPVKGTHAHSWVMSHESELESFLSYAQAMPNNCVFLVDTYDTIGGVENAIQVGRLLREYGYEMTGIRLDSGDIAGLSVSARKMLDAAGFQNVLIVASDDLDEARIERMFSNGAQVSVLGVGTNLITGGTQSALGGVYKLAAIEDADGKWNYRVKLSEVESKISNPGIQQIRRFYKDGVAIGDAIYDVAGGLSGDVKVVMADNQSRVYPATVEYQDMLKPIFLRGILVYKQPNVTEIREYVRNGLQELVAGQKKLSNADVYPVGLESGLNKTKLRITTALRKKSRTKATAKEVQQFYDKMTEAASGGAKAPRALQRNSAPKKHRRQPAGV
ncbi:MAG: nicotinate phosphoribosyltransferase [Candidatus Obscuribacterales bacterium]|nr:nicotinate phosphoribosyltransferase [Candidatus Obscuribacterales bacterium]